MIDSDIKKILHVTFNMEIGGTEQVICKIIENSDSRRFRHEVACIDGKVGTLGQELLSRGYTVSAFNRRPGVDLLLVKFLRGLIKQQKFDVLHCHQYSPFFYGTLAVLGTDTRLIFTEHGRFYPDRRRFKRRFINPLLARRANHIIAISKSTAKALMEYEYITQSRIEVIYNGIDDHYGSDQSRDDLLQELGLSADVRYIGTIARLEPIKNQKMMIEAFASIRDRFPDYRLLLIGDGSIRSQLEELVRDLDIREYVTFLGLREQARKYLKVFDIFLLSSYSEGTSMTLLEAMSMSVPCLVTDVGGNPEIVIDDSTGLVVPSDCKELFADAMSTLLENKEIRKRYGMAGRQRFSRRFNASWMVEQYEALYLS